MFGRVSLRLSAEVSQTTRPQDRFHFHARHRLSHLRARHGTDGRLRHLAHDPHRPSRHDLEACRHGLLCACGRLALRLSRHDGPLRARLHRRHAARHGALRELCLLVLPAGARARRDRRRARTRAQEDGAARREARSFHDCLDVLRGRLRHLLRHHLDLERALRAYGRADDRGRQEPAARARGLQGRPDHGPARLEPLSRRPHRSRGEGRQ